jgi:hypothetical protein
MRIVYFIVCLISTLSIATDYSIVFVHLGDDFPAYIHDAVEQAYCFNPECAVYVIVNKEALAQQSSPLDKRATLIYCEDLPMSAAHREFLHKSTLNDSLNGFWIKATERFFYLAEFMEHYQLTQVFHLEYDTMIYVDFHELLPIFKTYNGIAAVFDTDTRCIPNLLYIPHHAALNHMVTFIASRAEQGLNDMQSIGLYRLTYGNEYIDSLPIIPSEYLTYDSLKVDSSDPSIFYHNIDQFHSLFDGAALGQYLGGISPRNGPAVPGFINPHCVFDPSKFTFVWILDEKERKVPYIEYYKTQYRINILHIHSKNLHNFKSKEG